MAPLLLWAGAICGAQSASQVVGAHKRHAATSTLAGFVFDSVRGRPLAGAEVLAEGTAISAAKTDSSGNFTIKTLPAGNYRVSVSHPYLDSLEITLASPDFRLAEDSVMFVSLAVPSAKVLLSLKCPRRLSSDAPSAIMGRVESAGSLDPVANAEVSLSWTTFEVSQRGVQQTTRVLRDTSNLRGAYKFCGLPGELQARLETRVRSQLRSVATVEIPDRAPSIGLKNVILPQTTAGVDLGASMVSGRVELPDGRPARGASVELAGTPRKVSTDDRGHFTLDSVPIGIQEIRVRMLGFQEDSVTLNIEPTVAQGLVIRLKDVIPVLATVNVSATLRDRTLERVGFTQRSQHSVGHFVTPDELARKTDFQFTDLLRGIPGLRVGIDKYGEDVVTSPRAGGSILNSTNGCVQYFVDGQPWGNGALESRGAGRPQDSAANKMLARIAIETARQINAVLKKNDILGIEVYQGGGAPAYFNQGGHNCATIVVWTVASLTP